MTAASTLNVVNYNDFTNQTYNMVISNGSPSSNLNSTNYAFRECQYIKVGKMVLVQGQVRITGLSGLSSDNSTLNFLLPINSLSRSNLVQTISIGALSGLRTTSGINSASQIQGVIGSNDSTFSIQFKTTGSYLNLTREDIDTTAPLVFQFRYGGCYISNTLAN